MSTDSAAGAPRCPTCPDGLCPSINTTPHYPEPDADRIAKAELAISDAFAELFHIEDRHEACAELLIDALRKSKYGEHRLPAIYWAIHCLVQKKMLSAHARTMPVISPGDDLPKGGGWFQHGLAKGLAWHTYGDEPAQYNTFIVRAEEALWRWWRQQGSESAFSKASPQRDEQCDEPHGDTYLPKQLRHRLGISTTTLNKYAKLAGVKTPGRGKRNHRYTKDEYELISRQLGPSDTSPRTKK